MTRSRTTGFCTFRTGKAGDPATALAICKAQGVVVEKLRRMTPEKAAVVYATTLATATPEN